ncbi:MAG: PH domain-containing protein [Phycisphaerales bacterium]
MFARRSSLDSSAFSSPRGPVGSVARLLAGDPLLQRSMAEDAAAGAGGPGSEASGSGATVPITGARSGSTLDPAIPEEKICSVHPAMFKANPLKYLILVLGFFGGVGLMVAGAAMQESQWKYGLWLGALVALVAGVWWLHWWFFSSVCIRLEITNKRSIRHEGFIRRSSTEVLHDHVRSVDITQGFVQRMFNVGYIGIDSAGQDGIEIEIRDLPRPYDLKAIIDRYRRM